MSPEAERVDDLAKSVLDQMDDFSIPERLAVCSSLMSLVLYQGGLIQNQDAVDMAMGIMDQCVRAYGESLSRVSH